MIISQLSEFREKRWKEETEILFILLFPHFFQAQLAFEIPPPKLSVVFLLRRELFEKAQITLFLEALEVPYHDTLTHKTDRIMATKTIVVRSLEFQKVSFDANWK